MQAFFFGDAPRRLYGAFHEADAGAGASAGPAPAILVCGPHGQEGVRAHRLLRVLSDRLARQGMPVLRFDPYGSGDSAGDDEDLEWDGWIGDTALASAELARRCPGRPQVWIGARLGATVALQAAGGDRPARAAGARPRALVLCEPVLDGRRYLRAMAVATVEALEASASIKDPSWRQWLAQEPLSLEREGLGFAIGVRLHDALSAWTPAGLHLPVDAAIRVIGPVQDPSGGVAQAAAAGLSVLRVSYDFDWTAEEALNTAIVPHELLQALADAVTVDLAP